ncbi:MAG: transporter [Gemmatimonadetes bacterium]|nr:transporter [Gemmatimonadota bacterium]
MPVTVLRRFKPEFPEESFDTHQVGWYIFATKNRPNPCFFIWLRVLFQPMTTHTSRISIGRFLPMDSPLHALDARTKVLCSVGLVASLFWAPASTAWGFALGSLAPVVVGARIPFSYLLGNLRPLAPIVILTVVLNGIYTPGTGVHPSLPLTAEGLVRGGELGLRLVVIVTVTALLSLTTSPLDLADGIQSMLSPLSRLRIPVHELALTTTIALRLIPLLSDEALRIRTAQLARGASSQGGLTRKLKDLSAILIPLFIAAFGRSERLAEAMAVRGYSGAEGRTRYRMSRLGPKDLAAVVTTTIILWLAFTMARG